MEKQEGCVNATNKDSFYGTFLGHALNDQAALGYFEVMTMAALRNRRNPCNLI